MALDGIFLSAINLELQNWLGSRVDRIYQISKFEVVFLLRKPGARVELLISANSSSARINLTNKNFESPKTPPMFCVILRKYLVGARFISSCQLGFDRTLFLNFEGRNEIGDLQNFALAIEIMGKHSNIILFERGDKKIIDAIKRVDEDMSKVRIVWPGVVYNSVKLQNKFNILNCDLNQLLNRIFAHTQLNLAKALMATIEGISPIVARELAFNFSDKVLGEFDADEKAEVLEVLQKLKSVVESKKFKYVALIEKTSPKEFCWLDVKQYGGLLSTRFFNTASELVEFFYDEKVLVERINQRCYNVVKRITDAIEKAKHKKENRMNELNEAENRDSYKIYGDLLCANIYKVKKGDTKVEVLNFYNNNERVVLNLAAFKTPSQNVEHFYKIYKKSRVARQKLQNLIKDCDNEIAFLESELDLVLRSKAEEDVLSVVADLVEQGFYKKKIGKKVHKFPRQWKMNFLKFRSTDGFEILCGRNNRQNDYLTTKKASKTDLWFHVQDYSGSHVVVLTKGQSVSQTTINEAAIIAAVNSSVSGGTNVAVDFALIKDVKKPNGSRPGMVIFKNNTTVYVNPDEALVNRLEV